MINSLKEYNPDEYVKLTYSDNIHNDYLFVEGMNTDIYTLAGDETCKGGFFFCRFKDINYWFRRFYNGNIWRVRLPEGEQVLDYGNKLRARTIILHDCKPFYSINELCAIAVSASPIFLEYVHVKTPFLCHLAIKNRNFPWVREYVNKFGLVNIEDYLS